MVSEKEEGNGGEAFSIRLRARPMTVVAATGVGIARRTVGVEFLGHGNLSAMRRRQCRERSCAVGELAE
jgi:hypothetical protein